MLSERKGFGRQLEQGKNYKIQPYDSQDKAIAFGASELNNERAAKVIAQYVFGLGGYDLSNLSSKEKGREMLELINQRKQELYRLNSANPDMIEVLAGILIKDIKPNLEWHLTEEQFGEMVDLISPGKEGQYYQDY